MKKMMVAIILTCSLGLLACGKTENTEVPVIETDDEIVVKEDSDIATPPKEEKVIAVPEDREWTVSENIVVKLSGFAQLEEFDEEKATVVNVAGNQVDVLGDGIRCEGRRIIIEQEGCYVFSGQSDNARIVVDAEKAKVQIVLNGLQLKTEDGAVIYGKEAKKISITCPEGTENILEDAMFSTKEDEKAAIYATCDLFLNGTGSLKVKGNYKDGIASKDDLKIYHMILDVEATGHALRGNDSILLVDTNVTVYGGEDGCHVKEKETMEKGYLMVVDSYLYVTAEDDCLQVPVAIVLRDAEVICRAYDKIVNCEGYLEGTDDIMVWR